ncbi:MAG TPA: glycosyl hydrolase family 17 protein [Thermoanaerobaculia bacterium]|nr:glycosyl hydrolase family 17 protein [Thermoanaerobaculia bacterium]
MTALAARGSHLYAGTKAGLFRSVDGGASWQPASAPGGEVHALAVDPLGRVFAATDDAGMVQSTDGTGWSTVSSSPSMRDVRALFVTDAGDLYAGTERGSVFRSVDRGIAWTPVYPGLRSSRVAGFCATNDGLFVAAGGRILRTEAEFRIFGLNFSPYQGSQDPSAGATVTEAQLTERLQIIRADTWWMRTFGSSADLMPSGPLAHARGLRTAIGGWLARDAAANEAQLRNLIEAGRRGDAELLIVGSEVLLRSDLSEAQLIAHIQRVRQEVPGVPIAYADTHVQWLAHPAVVDAVDVILVNYYPYWEGIKIDSAVGAVHAWHRDVLAASKGRPVIVSETGWPAAGNTVGDAVPSLQNATRFFLNFVSWARATHTRYFYFEAFDEPWKARYEGPQGAHWGVWDEHGLLKPGMGPPLDGATIRDNWSSTEVVGGPGTPSIELTAIPKFGTSEDLRGRVLHVNPYLYKILVYLNVGSWWVKPYANRPLTTIANDGTWICDVTTGGIDASAVKYAVFLVRSSYQPPILLGASTIPASVRSQAVASVEVTRTPP